MDPCCNYTDVSDCSCFQSYCGAPFGASCVQTEDPSNSLGVAQNNRSNVSDIINNLTILGYGIASAVTDRPVVTNKQGVPSLGSKPLITGQVTAQQVLIVVGLALAGFLVYKGVK